MAAAATPPSPCARGGSGLGGMRERLRLYGGHLQLHSAPGERHPPARGGAPGNAAGRWNVQRTRLTLPAAARSLVRMGTIRVLIADDHTLVRESLVGLLQAERRRAGRGAGRRRHRGARAGAIATRPDVVVTDLAMPGLNGVEVVRRLRESLPDTRVLVLTMHQEDEYVLQAVRAGASGYLVKDSAAAELLAAVRSLHAGRGLLRARRRRALWPNSCSTPTARSTTRTAGSPRASARSSTSSPRA